MRMEYSADLLTFTISSAVLLDQSDFFVSRASVYLHPHGRAMHSAHGIRAIKSSWIGHTNNSDRYEILSQTVDHIESAETDHESSNCHLKKKTEVFQPPYLKRRNRIKFRCYDDEVYEFLSHKKLSRIEKSRLWWTRSDYAAFKQYDICRDKRRYEKSRLQKKNSCGQIYDMAV